MRSPMVGGPASCPVWSFKSRAGGRDIWLDSSAVGSGTFQMWQSSFATFGQFGKLIFARSAGFAWMMTRPLGRLFNLVALMAAPWSVPWRS